MTDEGVREVFFKMPVTGMFVGHKQADVISDGLTNKPVQGCGIRIGNDARDHVALALDSANNNELASNPGSGMFLIPMPIAVAAADVGFVNFDDAAQLGFRLNESRANFVAHGMRRAVAPEAHDALNLESANSLLAGQHQMHDAKPLAERLIRIFKDGASDMREAIGGHRSAFIALPVKLPSDQR